MSSDKPDGDQDRPDPTPPVDELVHTRHRLAVGDGELAYTARTGRIVVGEEEVTDDVFGGWKGRAELSVTAYTLEDTDVTTRPITFVFNGGPGSSSVWLHMGLLGPRIVDVGTPAERTPPPFVLRDNAETLLAVSDLVFIDPMSTGHSRPVTGGKAKEYHGFGRDVEQVTELVRLWCTREDRWMSPKYLLGESYGTIRAVAVAERLSRRHAMALNGLVLVSSVLDIGRQDFDFLRDDDACLNFLPTYAAVAHYHGLHPDRSLAEVRAEAEAFAAGPYRLALAQGRRLPADEREQIVTTLARLAGLSEDYVDRAELRPEHERWCTEVLRDRGLAVGRIDGRYTGPLYTRIAEKMDADPSSDAIEGPFAAALNHYLRGELGSTLDLPYDVFASVLDEWSYKEFEGKPINVADRLERLMRVNPHLRVRIEYGYYDLATPYHAAEDLLAHLRLPDEAFDRIEHAYFETGHMPYLDEASRVREAAGIAAFVTGGAAPARP